MIRVEQDQLYVIVKALFWYDRICTMMLTLSWIHGCYYFLVKSEESHIFETAVLISCVLTSATNATYLVDYLLRLPFVKKAIPAIDVEVCMNL